MHVQREKRRECKCSAVKTIVLEEKHGDDGKRRWHLIQPPSFFKLQHEAGRALALKVP